MPRARKTTMSGAPAGPPVTPVNAPYGEGERALESQRRTPVPAGPPPAPGPPPGAGGPGPTALPAGPGPAPGDPNARLQAALGAMSKMRPPLGLTAPTQRPREPLTAGMPGGLGPGPEVLRTGDRVSRTLRLLAEVSDDPGFADLADLAASRGR